MRMRLAHARVAGSAFAIVFAAAGCTLLTKLDGLSDGDVSDAATDGALADASPVGDATADGVAPSDADTDAADSGPGDPCAGATFCDQFDRTAVQGQWGSAYTDNGGALELDTMTFTSAPKSLAMAVPDQVNVHAQLTSVDYPNTGHARVAFALKTPAPNRDMSLIRLQLSESGTGRYGVLDLFSLPTGLVVSEQVFPNAAGVGYSNTKVVGFRPGMWQRWTIELDARSAPTRIVVTLDGAEIIRKALNNTFNRSPFNVLLGAFYAVAGPPQSVSYDDVAITILP
jgi:hypothetical protein